jgi:hypothetical protein
MISAQARHRSGALTMAVVSRSAFFAALALALLGVGWAGAGRAAEEEPYPIWWSPLLELESLDRLDARLDRELDPGMSDIVVYKEVGGEEVSAVMNNCAAVIRLTDGGYEARGSNDFRLQLKMAAWCRAVEMLKRARPAKRSFSRDFNLDYKAMNYLPGFAAPRGSCGSACWLYAANEARIPASRSSYFLSILWRGINDIEIETRIDVTRFHLLARADFDGDDIEDILLLVDYYSTEGTAAITDMYVLTRDSSKGVFWVLESDRYLCPNYQCRGPYDFSEADPWPAPGRAIGPGR